MSYLIYFEELKNYLTTLIQNLFKCFFLHALGFAFPKALLYFFVLF